MAVIHLFIINPAAGKKNMSDELTRAINNVLVDTGIEYLLYITKSAGDSIVFIKKFLSEHPDSFVRIYACGGDGTLNEVVNGAYGFSNAAVGSVPTGSGNDFIKTLEQHPKEAFLSFKRMINGTLQKIDALTVGEKVSINIISTGFDAATGKGMVAYKRLPFVSGAGAYTLSLIKCLFTARKNKYSFIVDGEPLNGDGASGNYLFAIAANGRWYGGGYKAAPEAELSDGKIDFIRVETVSIPTFLRLVGLFRAGEHLKKLSMAKLQRCESLKIVTGKPVDVNIDGEIAEYTDPEIRIVKNAIDIIIPSDEAL